MPRRRKKAKKLVFGFTLMELLIVLGILTVLMSIVIIALNPFQQLNRANDVSTKAIANDFVSAAQQFYATEKEMPWTKNQNCKNEFASGKTLADMPDCTQELTGGGKLQDTYAQASQLKDLYVNVCGSSAVVCYNPKSKIENADAETKYDKFGVNQPGCPAASGDSANCYWCKPLNNETKCTEPTPTPTALPTPTPTRAPTATPTPPPDYVTLYGIGGYKLDDTKFFQTYAVLAFTDPGIPPNWDIDVSMRPDFGGTTSFTSIGYTVNGVPATTNTDTIFWVAYAGDGNFGTLTSPSYQAQTKLSAKHFAFISMPYEWSQYASGCGKTIYWRVVQSPNGGVGYYPTPHGPTYTGTIDCTTKVGVVSDWYDINNDGVVDWVDYIIEALQTKLRYGGWQPPE